MIDEASATLTPSEHLYRLEWKAIVRFNDNYTDILSYTKHQIPDIQ